MCYNITTKKRGERSMIESCKEIRLIKNKNSEYWELDIIKENDVFKIFHGENIDIYWTFISETNNNKFIITQENTEIYDAFDRLYQRIKNCQIFSLDNKNFAFSIETLKDIEQENQELNDWYKTKEAYKKLYNPETGIIEWFSDDECEQKANSVRIIPHEDRYELEFIKREDNYQHITSIRFKHFYGRYEYLNTMFYKHYNELCNINDQVHQISFQETIYQMKTRSMEKL